MQFRAFQKSQVKTLKIKIELKTPTINENATNS